MPEMEPSVVMPGEATKTSAGAIEAAGKRGQKLLTTNFLNGQELMELSESVCDIGKGGASLDEMKGEGFIDHRPKVCEMTNLVGSPILERVLESRLPIDTVLACKDGKIGAHRIVLMAVSPYVGSMFRDHKLGEVTTVVLPDVRRIVMETLLHLAYTGKMIFPRDIEKEVFETMECLLWGQTAQFQLTEVIVEETEPPRKEPKQELGAHSRRNGGPSVSTPSTHDTPRAGPDDMRKRRLSGPKDNSSSEKREKKKPKYDAFGRQIQVAVRSGNPIGKEGAQKLKKKREKRIVDEARYICDPPRFTSDPETRTVHVDLKKLPVVSVRIQKLRGSVCIEPSDVVKPRYLGSSRMKHRKTAPCYVPRTSRSSRSSGLSSSEQVKLKSCLELETVSGDMEQNIQKKKALSEGSTDDAESGFNEPESADSLSCASGHDSSDDKHDDENDSPLRSPESYDANDSSENPPIDLSSKPSKRVNFAELPSATRT